MIWARSFIIGGVVPCLGLACSRGDEPEPAPVNTEVEAAAGAQPAEPSPTPAPTAEKGPELAGSGDLTLSGAMEREIRGAAVLCGSVRMPGRSDGVSWALHDDELVLNVAAMSEEELAKPNMALQGKPPARWGYVYHQGMVHAARDRTVAKIDADFREYGGSRVVHVKATLKCPPL